MAQKAVVVTTPMEVTLMTTRHFVTRTFLACHTGVKARDYVFTEYATR